MDNNENYIEADYLNDKEIIKMYEDIVESGDNIGDETGEFINDGWLVSGCTVNGWAYCKSDKRLKNIYGPNKAGLNEINKVNVINFSYKEDETANKKMKHVGVIAQEIRDIFPNAVIEDSQGYLQIRSEDIFFAMLNSIKELNTKNLELTQKINYLEEKINK